MPFEKIPDWPRRIAVIGGGITGMGAAHNLAQDNTVVLFESEARLGGHARTIMAGPNRDQAVDTGFLVFNHANYPHLTSLFDELDVPTVKSDMSFAASIGGGRFEYGLGGIGALFAQKANLVNPQFWRMMRDVLRFNRLALEMAQEDGLTIGGLLDRLGTGKYFRDRYLLPFSGAIWSTPKEQILEFPAAAMLRFFENHALLGLTGQHQWYTVDGGSVQYVQRLERSMQARGVDLRLGAAVQGMRRTPTGVEVKTWGGEWEHFDAAVMATHSDDSLAILTDPTEDERRILSAIRYQPNDIVLHSDPAVMPVRRKTWSSWNYTEWSDKATEAIDMTYWINSLQPWLRRDDFFVTLNSTKTIRDELTWDTCTLRHPVYDLGALAAQEAVHTIDGVKNTWFCGAWRRNGFHEDGLATGLEASASLRAQTMGVAAE